MSFSVVFAFLVLTVVSTYGERVTCREARRNDGSRGFDCASVVPTSDLLAQNLYILWLKSGRSGQDRSVNIDVPNYQIQDVIQAASKGGSAQSHTNINVNLAKPDVSYIAQKEEKVGDVQQTFDVNLLYERLKGLTVHFANDGPGTKPYSPVRARAAEPKK